MGAFGGLILTNKGKILQAKAQAGAPLIYTRFGIGDGQIGSIAIADLTALKNQIMSLDLTKIIVQSNSRAVIGGVLDNNSLSSGFYFRELGVFATDPDIGEILYCYANAGVLAEYIPAGGGADIVEKAIDVQVLTGNAANVSALIDSSLIYLTESEKGSPGGVAPLNSEGYVPAEYLNIDFSTLATNQELDTLATEITTHTADYVKHPGISVTSGTSKAYTVTLDPAPLDIQEFFWITIIPHITNVASPTLTINGLGTIALKDQKGVAYAAGKLLAGKPYSFRKVGSDFLADSGGGGEYGTATAPDVLIGKTIGTENGIITGTLDLSKSSGEQLFATPGTYTFTVPDYIYKVFVVLQGAGGGGGGFFTFTGGGGNAGGGGGSGGSYIETIAVVPGEKVTVYVGYGGNPGTNGYNPTPAGYGNPGGQTLFKGIGANGGNGGYPGSTYGTGLGGAGGTGGGYGGNGVAGTNGSGSSQGVGGKNPGGIGDGGNGSQAGKHGRALIKW
ncbi:glycine-rich domain-containing protein [Psychrobacillus sp. FSL K6-1464]|uniref:glycine-rich domain-containing protein n=1 Tax=Psychrobacillus sp. FSL K6-1464 TaxID=2921545 RepID=UPI0030F55980